MKKKLPILIVILILLTSIVSAQNLEKAVKAIGCKVKKADYSVLFDTDFIEWKKKEFKMLDQTTVTASYGTRIYFEVERYALENDAENRLKNFKKVSPKIEAERKREHDKIATELEFCEAFRKGKKVYFVRVPSFGSWLDGDVTHYRRKLQKIMK